MFVFGFERLLNINNIFKVRLNSDRRSLSLNNNLAEARHTEQDK